MQVAGYWMLGIGYWMLDTGDRRIYGRRLKGRAFGTRLTAFGCGMLDTGY
jgi:hypothetical protein